MGYYMTRIAIGVVGFVLIYWLGRKRMQNRQRWCVLSLAFGLFLGLALCIVPFENALFGFSSCEKAFRYQHTEPIIVSAEGEHGTAVLYALSKGQTEKEDGVLLVQVPRIGSKWKLSSDIDMGTEQSYQFQQLDAQGYVSICKNNRLGKDQFVYFVLRVPADANLADYQLQDDRGSNFQSAMQDTPEGGRTLYFLAPFHGSADDYAATLNGEPVTFVEDDWYR